MVEEWAGESTAPFPGAVGDRFRRDKAGRLWSHPTIELVATPGQWVIAESDPVAGVKFSGCPPEIFSLTFRTAARSVFQPGIEAQQKTSVVAAETPSTAGSYLGEPRRAGEHHQDSGGAPPADPLAAALGPALIEIDGLIESLRAHRPASLAEIGAGVDTLDELLIPLLVHRFWLVEFAANFNSAQPAATVPKRTTEFVGNAAERAEACGASPGVAHAIEVLYSYLGRTRH
jgi:hypothetical protein